jgi:hypothetical protein
VSQWGSEFKKNLRDFPRMMYTLPHHMALAVESHSITLDPVAKAAWDLPANRARGWAFWKALLQLSWQTEFGNGSGADRATLHCLINQLLSEHSNEAE